MDLNVVRSIIEKRLAESLALNPPVPVVFNNMAFDTKGKDTFVQCLTSFGAGEYLTQDLSGNNMVGLIVLNVFTEEGVGAGSNFTVCTRIRDLFNRVDVSGVRFDAPIGPEIMTPSLGSKFQTQMRITFSIFEEL